MRAAATVLEAESGAGRLGREGSFLFQSAQEVLMRRRKVRRREQSRDEQYRDEQSRAEQRRRREGLNAEERRS